MRHLGVLAVAGLLSVGSAACEDSSRYHVIIDNAEHVTTYRCYDIIRKNSALYCTYARSLSVNKVDTADIVRIAPNPRPANPGSRP